MKESGLSISAYEPLLRGKKPLYALEHWSSYGHEISATAGFLSAKVAFPCNLRTANEWLDSGLLRHVEVRNQSSFIVWEGFVNQVNVTMGTLSASRGPALDIVNSVRVQYSPLDTLLSPGVPGIAPVTGTTTLTGAYMDTTSIARYGKFERVLSAGTIPDSIAPVIAQTYLKERAIPKSGEDLSFPASNLPSVTIQLLGYYHMLKRFMVNLSGYSTVGLSTRIQQVLALDPNGLFSTNYSGIESNALAVPVWEGDYKTAENYIASLAAIGTASYERTTFGVYEGRKVAYARVPNTVEYSHRITEQRPQVLRGQAEVAPWDVRPAKWIGVRDFDIGGQPAANPLDDPRNIFIEQVSYTAPFSLRLAGGVSRNVERKLKDLGLGGV